VKRKAGSSGTTTQKKQKKLTPTGKKSAKKKATGKITAQRRSPRVAARHDVTSKPVLRFTSSYTGTGTQRLGEEQSIMFDQSATLAMTTTAPHPITHYYELRQLVRDNWDFQTGETQALGVSVQDGPYHPDYNDPVITVTAGAISFQDTPGFSTTSKVAAGKWLDSYDVYFKWTVTDIATGQMWTSPEVHHTMTSAYNGGADSPVVRAPAGDAEWQVILPDRSPD
jgi:hypothetical protein